MEGNEKFELLFFSNGHDKMNHNPRTCTGVPENKKKQRGKGRAAIGHRSGTGAGWVGCLATRSVHIAD